MMMRIGNNMKEYIEREVALDILCDECCECTIENPFACEGCVQRAEVLRIPAADVAPVVHGEWVYDRWCEFKCSICGHWSNTLPRAQENYCPNCGARMDGGK